jgi:hypothetical protein
MAEPPTRPNGAAAWRPTLPTTIVVTSVVVALVAVSGLLYLLYTRTTGPGQVLREFIEQVEAGDCPGSYALLDPSLRVEPDRWCAQLEAMAGRLDPGFQVRRVILEGEVALVHITNPDGTRQTWKLRRADRSWRIFRAPKGLMLPR